MLVRCKLKRDNECCEKVESVLDEVREGKRRKVGKGKTYF